jgi:hypothetical protein
MLKGVYHIVIWLVKHFFDFFDFFTPSLFQRGKLTSPAFGVFLLPEAGKGRQGGISKGFSGTKFLLRKKGLIMPRPYAHPMCYDMMTLATLLI